MAERGIWLALTPATQLFHVRLSGRMRLVPRWRGLLRLPGGQVEWKCEHEHQSAYTANVCAKAEANARRRAELAHRGVR